MRFGLKKVMSMLLCVLIVNGALTIDISASTTVIGEGTESSPYLITSGKQLQALSVITASMKVGNTTTFTNIKPEATEFGIFTYPPEVTDDAGKLAYLRTAYYELTQNITVSLCSLNDIEKYFSGVGSSAAAFAGHFDGKGFTIELNQGASFSWNNHGDRYIGLFGYADGAKIKNINLSINQSIVMTQHCVSIMGFGALVGGMKNTTIDNCKLKMEGTAGNKVAFGFENTTNNWGESFRVGALIGKGETGNTITNSVVALTNATLKLVRLQKVKDELYLGGIAGDFAGTTTSRNTVSNCEVRLDDTEIYGSFGKNVIQSAYLGGAFGKVGNTDVSNLDVIFNESKIAFDEFEDTSTKTAYFSATAGGIAGFCAAGTSNTDNIYYSGVVLNNCSFTAENNELTDVINIKHNKGAPANVGGLVGCTYNSFVAEDCTVNITNGILRAERSEAGLAGDTMYSYGPVAGGIVGRMEHTGMIKNTSVTGHHLEIDAVGGETQVAAGGICGISIGPRAKDIVSFENCTFDGNGTSLIKTSIVESNLISTNNMFTAGGIVGDTSYRIEGCTVKNADIEMDAAKTYVVDGTEKTKISSAGGIAGYFRKDPVVPVIATLTKTAGIYSCIVDEVNIRITNDTDMENDVKKPRKSNAGGITGYNLAQAYGIADCYVNIDMNVSKANGNYGGISSLITYYGGGNLIENCVVFGKLSTDVTKLINGNGSVVGSDFAMGGIVGVDYSNASIIRNVYSNAVVDFKSPTKEASYLNSGVGIFYYTALMPEGNSIYVRKMEGMSILPAVFEKFSVTELTSNNTNSAVYADTEDICVLVNAKYTEHNVIVAFNNEDGCLIETAYQTIINDGTGCIDNYVYRFAKIPGAATVKVFIWDSVKGMKPLNEPLVKEV